MEKGEAPTHITVRGVDPDLWRCFRAEAVKRGVSAGRLLNDLLREWLEKQTK